jgi:hypothetical protein
LNYAKRQRRSPRGIRKESYVDSRKRRKAKSPVLAWKKERIMMNRGEIRAAASFNFSTKRGKY